MKNGIVNFTLLKSNLLFPIDVAGFDSWLENALVRMSYSYADVRDTLRMNRNICSITS